MLILLLQGGLDTQVGAARWRARSPLCSMAVERRAPASQLGCGATCDMQPSQAATATPCDAAHSPAEKRRGWFDSAQSVLPYCDQIAPFRSARTSRSRAPTRTCAAAPHRPPPHNESPTMTLRNMPGISPQSNTAGAHDRSRASATHANAAPTPPRERDLGYEIVAAIARARLLSTVSYQAPPPRSRL